MTARATLPPRITPWAPRATAREDIWSLTMAFVHRSGNREAQCLSRRTYGSDFGAVHFYGLSLITRDCFMGLCACVCVGQLSPQLVHLRTILSFHSLTGMCLGSTEYVLVKKHILMLFINVLRKESSFPSGFCAVVCFTLWLYIEYLWILCFCFLNS